MDTGELPQRHMRFGAVVGGLIVLAAGVALLLDQTGALEIRAGHLIGPFVLIVIGAAMIFDKGGVIYTQPARDENGDVRLRVRKRGGAAGGLWLIGIGVWLLVSQNHIWGLTFHTSWPLFVILAGIMILMRGCR
jgi:LiaI-LiaF-like transmembrane region